MTPHGQVERTAGVTCEACGEFEMGKSYRGGSGTDGEREYAGIDLPDECPVCGAALVETRGDGA